VAIQIITDQEQAALLREAGLLWRCYDAVRLEPLTPGWWSACDIRRSEWPVYEDDYITFAILIEE